MAHLTTPTRVLIAPDCGPGIGSGHLERALALAETLRSASDVAVLIPPHQTSIQRARAREIKVVLGGADLGEAVLREAEANPPTVMVLDGYRFSLVVQARLKQSTRLVVVDDLGEECDADIMVIPAPGGEQRRGPAGAARLLAGAPYAIMSQNYVNARNARSAQCAGRLVVVSGAADVGDLLGAILKALVGSVGASQVDVVVGPDGWQLTAPDGVTVHKAPRDLSAVFMMAAMYVGTAGTSAVQAAAVGVPMVISPVVANQVAQARTLEKAGAAVVVWGDDVPARMAATARLLVTDSVRRRRMGEAGRVLVDGQGAQRVAAAILDLARAEP